MKYIFNILLYVALLILTSCEPFGIEVTTLKGKWKSDKTDGQHILLSLSDDDIYSAQIILNDTILLIQRHGTWILKNDTLNIYSQNLENKGVRNYYIEQLSMNAMTLRKIKDGDILVFHRVYSNQNLDYDERFEEVFDLKRGFWWYVWRFVLLVSGTIIVIGFLYCVRSLINNLTKRIRKIHKNE